MIIRPADLDDNALAALLEWVFTAPPLLAPMAGTSLFDTWLAPCSPDPTLLAETRRRLADSKDQRLGKLFEEMTLLAIAHQPTLAIISHNLVIRDGQKTIGELDLIVHDRANDKYLHVEVALKFYLGVRTDYWPGPNSRDTFERKRTRMATHQLPLITDPATRASLHALGIPRVDGQCLFSRGRLFYPHAQDSAGVSAPAGSHPTHARGDWFYCRHLPPQYQWRTLQKPQWLSAAPLSDKCPPPLATAELIDYVQAKGRPVMAVPEHAPAAPPCFVVPDEGWPDH